MTAPIAHGAAGGADEFLILGAVVFLAWGIVRARDRGRRRWVAVPILAAGLGMIAAPIALRVRGPQTAAERIASTARLAVISPAPGARVAGRWLEVVVRLEGARVSPETSTRLRPDVGHLHLYLDGRLVSMTAGTRQRVDVSGLARGPHLLRVEFAAIDHGPFRPPVETVTTFLIVERPGF